MMNKEQRKQLRKQKIQARNNLTAEQREIFSRQIVDRILASKVFQEAETIMIYRTVKGEVRLDALEEAALKLGKRLAYPLCISDREMIALMPRENLPADKSAWKSGYCGIMEPIREMSVEIAPKEIDMVICPCTAFDEHGGRLGMGAGFYDRFLEKCLNAYVAAVAFEVQKADHIPMEAWDKRMEAVFTEEAVYLKMQNK